MAAGMEVTTLNPMVLITVFVIYLIIHIVIGVQLKKAKEELGKTKTEEAEQKVKTLNILFKWFPAVAVILVVLVLYF